MKCESGGVGDERGPLSKANRKSLKFASQARKKEEGPPRKIETSLRGRRRRRRITGKRKKSLSVPFGMIFPIV